MGLMEVPTRRMMAGEKSESGQLRWGGEGDKTETDTEKEPGS